MRPQSLHTCDFSCLYSYAGGPGSVGTDLLPYCWNCVTYCTPHILKCPIGLLSEQGHNKTSGRESTRHAIAAEGKSEGRGAGGGCSGPWAVHGTWEMEPAWVESVESRSAQ